MSNSSLKIIPKLRTERLFPSKEFRLKTQSAAAGVLMNSYIKFPNDKWINRFLATGFTAYLADIWNPISPIGEISLGASFLAAKLRHSYLKEDLDLKYKNETMRAALRNLSLKN